MLTKVELGKEWDISFNSGIIRNRGIYEGEFWPVIVYDEWANTGSEDEIFYNGNEETAVFYVNQVERDLYELGESAYAVTVHSSSVGFVHFSIWTEAQFEALAAELE